MGKSVENPWTKCRNIWTTSMKEMEVHWKIPLYTINGSFYGSDKNRTIAAIARKKEKTVWLMTGGYIIAVVSLFSAGRGWSGHYLQRSRVKQSEAGAFWPRWESEWICLMRTGTFRMWPLGIVDLVLIAVEIHTTDFFGHLATLIKAKSSQWKTRMSSTHAVDLAFFHRRWRTMLPGSRHQLPAAPRQLRCGKCRLAEQDMAIRCEKRMSKQPTKTSNFAPENGA